MSNEVGFAISLGIIVLFATLLVVGDTLAVRHRRRERERRDGR